MAVIVRGHIKSKPHGGMVRIKMHKRRNPRVGMSRSRHSMGMRRPMRRSPIHSRSMSRSISYSPASRSVSRSGFLKMYMPRNPWVRRGGALAGAGLGAGLAYKYGLPSKAYGYSKGAYTRARDLFPWGKTPVPAPKQP